MSDEAIYCLIEFLKELRTDTRADSPLMLKLETLIFTLEIDLQMKNMQED